MAADPRYSSRGSHWLILLCLVFAGEMIFSLPFHVARFFRPTLLDVFGLSNSDLGDIFAVYGVTAMLAYFPGGAVADRFSARQLMSVSLLATAAGGLYLAQIPGRTGLMALFAYWGITSILLFWAALIKATRQWGGDLEQGRAFGILDGGRGLMAAAIATLAVGLLAVALPADPSSVSGTDRQTALQSVIYFYTAVTGAAGIVVWWAIPAGNSNSVIRAQQTLAHIVEVLGKPVIWCQAGIVICAYCGYKGIDNYGLYAVEVLGKSEVEAAGFTATAAYIRPLAAVGAGFLADRWTASRIVGAGFALLVPAYAVLAFTSPATLGLHLLYANLVVTFFAVFAIRAVYFALLEETRIDKGVTGTAVGLISLVGFTPDIFFAPIAGRLLDSAPGVAGHQHYFMLLSGFAIAGLTITLALTVFARARRRARF
jgi:nitrate/nitrite transporter NarK